MWSYQTGNDFLLLTADTAVSETRQLLVSTRCIVTAIEHVRNGKVAGSMLTLSNGQRMHVTQTVSQIVDAIKK